MKPGSGCFLPSAHVDSFVTCSHFPESFTIFYAGSTSLRTRKFINSLTGRSQLRSGRRGKCVTRRETYTLILGLGPLFYYYFLFDSYYSDTSSSDQSIVRLSKWLKAGGERKIFRVQGRAPRSKGKPVNIVKNCFVRITCYRYYFMTRWWHTNNERTATTLCILLCNINFGFAFLNWIIILWGKGIILMLYVTV